MVEMDIIVLQDNKHSLILILVIRKRVQLKTCLVNVIFFLEINYGHEINEVD